MTATKLVLAAFFVFVFGAFAYGQTKELPTEKITYQGKEYQVNRLQKGVYPSHIAFQTTTDGTRKEWSKQIWLAPKTGRRLKNDRRLPVGTRILTPIYRVQTKPVEVKNLSVAQLCKLQAGCVKQVVKINRLKDATSPVSAVLWVPKSLDISVKTQEQPAAQTPAEPVSDTKYDYKFFLAILLILSLAAALLVFKPKIPKLKLPSLPTILSLPPLPKYFIPHSEQKEKLALIRRDIIYRINTSSGPRILIPARLKIAKFRASIIYNSSHNIGPVAAAFLEAQSAYRHAGAKFIEAGRGNKLKLNFSRLNNVSIQEIRTWGSAWLDPTIREFNEVFFKALSRPQASRFNRKPFEIYPSADIGAGFLYLEIAPLPPDDDIEGHELEELVDLTLERLDNSIFEKHNFVFEKGIGTLTLKINPKGDIDENAEDQRFRNR